MATKIISWEGTTTLTAIRQDNNNQTALAQRFTVGDSYNIEFVRFNTKRFNPCGNITIALYDRDNGNPNSSLGSVVVDASGWDTAFSMVRTFTFAAPISITAGNYAIVFTDSTNYGIAIGLGTAGAGPRGAIKLIDGSWLEQGTPTRTYYHEIWAAPSAPSDPTDPTPAHEATGIALNDTILTWKDGGRAETYDVYFRPFGEFFEKIASDITDIFIDAIVAHTVAFNGHYSYGQLYFWCVIAKNEYGSNYTPPVDYGIGYGGTIWEFNAVVFEPPLPSGITLDEDGVPTGTPTGENNMITVRRLVAAANDKIWVEDV